MSYENLLMRYGSVQESGETRVYIHAMHPRRLTETKDIIYRDKRAAEDIAQLERIIEDLKDYRKALAERYGELETMPYTRQLKLERYPHWKGHIEYIVTITRSYTDKTKVEELREVYPGKERKNALSRTNDLLKQYPGIPYEIDTEKKSWEK